MLHIHPVAISLYVTHPFPRIRINPFLAGLLQDKQDDIMVGVKSTALKFGDDSKYWLSGFATVMVTGLAATGHLCDQTWPYFAGVAFVAAHLSHQVRSSRKSHPEILSSESVPSHWHLSISGRCCLDGYSIHQLFVPLAIQLPPSYLSSTYFFQHLFGLPLFLWPFTFPSSINFSSVWCLCMCPN